jgi:hypothetical protein
MEKSIICAAMKSAAIKRQNKEKKERKRSKLF